MVMVGRTGCVVSVMRRTGCVVSVMVRRKDVW